MLYVALLRGINIGGHNKIDMKRLKITFENLGLTWVKTYINSGNVIFDSNTSSTTPLTSQIEKAISADFGLDIKVLIRSKKQINQIVENLPTNWTNDTDCKCDIMFLWPNSDNPQIIKDLNPISGIDNLKYLSGAVIWQIDRQNINKSGLAKLAGTKLYKEMTIRNCNTVRKINELFKQN